MVSPLEILTLTAAAKTFLPNGSCWQVQGLGCGHVFWEPISPLQRV